MTAAVANRVTTRPVRLRPAPILEPPYDDEVSGSRDGGPVGPHDVELPLDWSVSTQVAHAGIRRTRSGIGAPSEGGDRTTATPAAVKGVPGRWRTTKDDLPLTIKRFADMYVEVLNERRPPRHLLPCVTDEVFQTIRMGLVRRGRGWWPVVRRPSGGGRGRSVPVRPGCRPQAIRVRRLRACQPAPGVVEAAAVLGRGDETRAVAFRLEYRGARWTCTAFEFLG